MGLSKRVMQVIDVWLHLCDVKRKTKLRVHGLFMLEAHKEWNTLTFLYSRSLINELHFFTFILQYHRIIKNMYVAQATKVSSN